MVFIRSKWKKKEKGKISGEMDEWPADILLMLVSVSIFAPVINVSSVDSAEKCGCNPTSPSPADSVPLRAALDVTRPCRGAHVAIFLPSCSTKLFSVFRMWGDKLERTHNESQRTRGHLCHLQILQQGYQVGSVADTSHPGNSHCWVTSASNSRSNHWRVSDEGLAYGTVNQLHSRELFHKQTLCMSLYLLPPLYRADSWWLIWTQTSSRAAVCRLWSACEVSFDGVVLLSLRGWGAFKQTVFYKTTRFQFYYLWKCHVSYMADETFSKGL